MWRIWPRRFDHMVVGVIEKIEPHPNADKLRVCKTDIETARSRTSSAAASTCGRACG